MGADEPQLLVSVEFEVHGNVQGVYFTKYCKELAEQRGVGGWVKNTKRGTIVGKMQGSKHAVDAIFSEGSERRDLALGSASALFGHPSNLSALHTSVSLGKLFCFSTP